MRPITFVKVALVATILAVYGGSVANAGLDIKINKTTQRMAVSDDAPMPHSIFFTYRGHAIHGSYQTRSRGRAVSHGCVRLSPGNAAKLYSLVTREGMGNTRITITGGGAGLADEFAPIAREVRKIVPQVKRQFGDWLDRNRNR